MIKIIIKEQKTKAGTAAAGTQAIRSYYNPQTKIKSKSPKEETPVTDAASSQPKQPTSEPQEEIVSVPAGWKPQKRTTVKLKNNKGTEIVYRVANSGKWVGPDNNPVKNDLISALNLEAYKQEKAKSTSTQSSTTPTSTSPTVSLGAEDAPTEEAAPPVTVEEISDEIDYIQLYSDIYERFDLDDVNNIPPFVEVTVGYLMKNELFKQAHEKMKNSIAKETAIIFNDFKFIKNIEDASKTIANFFMENHKKQRVLESIDPTLGLAILTGVFAYGGIAINKYFKNQTLIKDFENTVEAKYLKKLGLLLLVKFISSFIDDPKNIDSYISSASHDITEYMKQFKQARYILFRQTKLFKKITEDLIQEADALFDQIWHKSKEQYNNKLSESTINRWKVLAKIKNSEV